MTSGPANVMSIDDYALRHIRHRARQLARTEGFTAQDIEDIQQDLIMDLLERLSKFDATKATCNMFVTSIIDRKVAAFIRDRNCKKRNPRREECSLNECIDDGEGGSIERIQTIAANSNQETTDLALDVEAVINRLSDDLRRLCELLKTNSITDTARAMGVPRTTLYTYIRQLRKVFKAAGLQNYLAGRSSFCLRAR